MKSSYVSLHIHSEYDGSIIKLRDLANHARHARHQAISLTDTGSLSAIYPFFTACKNEDIQPLAGMQLSISGVPAGDHTVSGFVVLYVQNEEGWRNLLMLCNAGQCGSTPVAWEFLSEHHQGLVVTTGGMEGVLTPLLGSGDLFAAANALSVLKTVFANRIFAEVFNHGTDEDRFLAQKTVVCAAHCDVPLCAGLDARYVNRDEHDRYDLYTCMREKKTVDDPDRSRLAGAHHIPDRNEIDELFAGMPAALENTLEIAAMCEGFQLPHHAFAMPMAQLPGGRTPEEELARVARDGLVKRGLAKDPAAVKRLEHELEMLTKSGHAAYFLFYHAIARYAARRRFPVVARGAAAGSMLCYCLGITPINPLEHRLYFERFYNPQRSSLPDIDIDVPSTERDSIVTWLKRRYGAERITEIRAWGRLREEAIIRMATKALKLRQDVVDMLYRIDWENRFELNAAIAAAVVQCPEARPVVDAVRHLNRIVFKTGKHASGFAVCETPLHQCVPLVQTSGHAMTACDMASLDQAGIHKVDILGSNPLDMLRMADAMMRAQGAQPLLPLERLPTDDAQALNIFSSGATEGIMHFESGVVKDLLGKENIDSFEFLVVRLGFDRPGPMPFGPRQDDASAAGRHPLEKRICDKTLGWFVFQEQVMDALIEIGGMNPAEADMCRRQIQRKNLPYLRSVQPSFEANALKQGMPQEFSRELFERLIEQGSYAATHAHTLVVALTGYAAGYVKARHPEIFYAAALDALQARYNELREAAKKQNVVLLSPDYNLSGPESAMIAPGTVRLGLCHAKNTRRRPWQIIRDRERNGRFKDIVDFGLRLPTCRKSLSGLVAQGLFDSFGPSRAYQFSLIKTVPDNRSKNPVRPVQAAQPCAVTLFDVLKELVSRHDADVDDISLDIYSPRSYKNSERAGIWMRPTTFLAETSSATLAERAHKAVAAFGFNKKEEYVVGFNSRLGQYSEKQFVMLDIDAMTPSVRARLRNMGGWLVRSGRGFHYVSPRICSTKMEWDVTMRQFLEMADVGEAVDQMFVELSLRRGYATLRMSTCARKPVEPVVEETWP